MTGTYTYAILEVSPEAYREIFDKLVQAGYRDVIDIGSRGEIDMHGLAIRPIPEDSPGGDR